MAKKLRLNTKTDRFMPQSTDGVVFRGRRFSSLNTWAMHCARLVVPEIKWVDTLKRVFFQRKNDFVIVLVYMLENGDIDARLKASSFTTLEMN